MTKKEVCEDVKKGSHIKIYTKSDEVFSGEVIDLGSSSLKIIIGDSDIKRILYERIIEYDVKTTSHLKQQPADFSDNSNIEKVKSTIGSELNTLVTPLSEKQVSKNHTSSINRDTIFDNIAFDEDLVKIKEYWSDKLKIKNNNEYSKIINIITYAHKIHEFDLNNDRIKRAIALTKEQAKVNKGFNIIIGHIYHELRDYQKATEYYCFAGAYSLAFKICNKYGLNNLTFKNAVLAVEFNEEDESVIKWLCEYAIAKNDFSIIVYLVNHSEKYLGKVLIYWYADKPELDSSMSNDAIFSSSNIDNLKIICLKENIINSSIQDIISSEKDIINEHGDKERIVIENELQKGIIQFYNKNGGTGTIRNINGGTIHFYIKQVKDYELQRILTTETDCKKRVTYIRGVNMRGEIAADEVTMDLVADLDVSKTFDGVIDYYNCDTKMGKIRAGNTLYNFNFNSIIDPLLFAEIMDMPFEVQCLEVKFKSKDYISKKNKVSKIAFDIAGKKTYTKEKIDYYIKQKYITLQNVNEWLNNKKEKNNKVFSFVPYEPLCPLESYAQMQNSENRQVPAFILPELIDADADEQKAVEWIFTYDKRRQET